MKEMTKCQIKNNESTLKFIDFIKRNILGQMKFKVKIFGFEFYSAFKHQDIKNKYSVLYRNDKMRY